MVQLFEWICTDEEDHALFSQGETLHPKSWTNSTLSANGVRTGKRTELGDPRRSLMEIEDEVLGDGWESPVMYRMVESTREVMVTFPNPVSNSCEKRPSTAIALIPRHATYWTVRLIPRISGAVYERF